MLALKDLLIMDRVPPKRNVLDLPDEMIDQVIMFLYIDGGRFKRDLIPASLSCSRLRKAAAPLLFDTICVRLTERYVDRRTFNMLLHLELASRSFAKHVRHIKQDDSYCLREKGCEELKLSNELVTQLALQGLRTLDNLRTVSVGCLNSPLICLLPTIFPEKSFQVHIAACGCSPRTNNGGSLMHSISNDPRHKFAVSINSPGRPVSMSPWATQHPSRTYALCWDARSPPRHVRSFSADPSLSQYTCLQELHLKATNLATYLPMFRDTLVQLLTLRRLSIAGPHLCSAVLSVVPKLENLESLRFNSVRDEVFQDYIGKHEFEGLPYLHLPKLTSLEIRYINRHLSIKHIVPKSIKHLRIEHRKNERLTPFDLRWISQNAPDLECLEITVGTLANLWHPTAIAGVDVDVEVYGMLEALSSFKRLRTLRLFPPYWQARTDYLHFVQPVADEQAVRIFNHLRHQCLKLRLLIISNSYSDYLSRKSFSSRGLSEPIKWLVRPLGAKALLITHEAEKRYHLEQVWEGDRRLTMTTVRHNGRKLHFDELEDWALPMYEFPFDEPLPCHFSATADGAG